MNLAYGMVMTLGSPTRQPRSLEDVLAEIRAKVASEPRRITEAEAQERFVSLASELVNNWEEAHRLAAGLDREWPEAMMDSVVAPTLVYSLFCAADTVEQCLDEALEAAWPAATDTEESVRSGWGFAGACGTSDCLCRLAGIADGKEERSRGKSRDGGVGSCAGVTK